MQNQPNICPQCQSPIPADAPGGLCPACVLLGVAGRTNPSQAAAAAAPTGEEVAAAFPEMEILDILGQGGMGIVFKARQPRLDRFVALKILPPALAAQPGFAERFTREARVLARLAHANIVSIYDFGERAGFFYLIMEFVNGVNLRAAMRAGVTPEQALLLVPRICEALQFAHDHGVLHRDIKPENILLDTAGVPKLADFGIAKLSGEEKTGLTATGHALGTAAYMAPEQVEKPATVDHRADIYSLGVVLYEMLTGELPLGRFGAPSEKSPVDRGVDEVVMRALEKERERRQQSAKDFKTQVEGASHPGVPFVARTGPKQDALVTRVLIALCAVSGAGIPIMAMFHSHAPAPQHMVGLTIFFGVLAGMSRMFVRADEAAVKPRGVGGTEAVRDPLLKRIFLAMAAICGAAIPLSAASDWHVPSAGHLLFFAFFFLVLAMVSRFFSPEVEVRTANLPPDTAANPWPHRLAWLIVGLVVLPILAIGCALLVPMLVRGHLAVDNHPNPWAASCMAMLPFVAGAGIYYIYRRTLPGPEQATPRTTWNPWPKRVFLALLVFVGVPVTLIGLALGIPLMAYRGAAAPHRVPAQLKEVRPLAPATAVVTPDHAPFIGRLSVGTIELVSIANHPSGDEPGWEMDGAPAKEGPFINRRSTSSPLPGERAREFVFRVRDLPPDASTPTWQVPGSSGWAGGGTPELTARPAQNGEAARPEAPAEGCQVISASFPASSHKATVRMGIATLPWQTLRELVPGSQFTSSFSHDGEDWAVTQNSTLETKDDQLVASYACPRHENFQTRVTAVTTAGKEVLAVRSTQFGDQAEYRFDHLPLANVKYFRFQARRYEWVEFQNVALAPKGGNVARNAQEKRALSIGPATLDVHYGKADPKVPGFYKLTLGSRTPYGWVTDFSFRMRDEKGERELPYVSFVVAQQQPTQPNGAPDVGAEVAWEFNTRDMKEGFFQLNGKLNKGSVGNAGGSTSEATAYRWEPHPGRSEWTRNLSAEAPSQILFLHGVPAEADKPEAEMYVEVKIRPMNSREKAEGFQGFLGPDRFEKLLPLKVRQDEAIQRAAQQLDEMRGRIKAGIFTPVPLEAAERDLAIAEARGDEAKIAAAQAAYAEAHAKAMQAGGAISVEAREELRKERQKIVSQIEEAARRYLPGHRVMKDLQAQLDRVDKALIELEKAGSKPALAPEPAAPAVPAKPAPSPEITRLQDEKIRIAREQLAIAKKRVEAGTATLIEQAAVERDLAIVEGRGNELLTASALSMYADKRYQTARARADAGTGTTADALEAEQDLNSARLRLQEARAVEESKRDPNLPAPLGDPNATKEAIERLRNEGVRLAYEQLALARKLVEAGTVPIAEVDLAERNVAVAKARGDELKTAEALVAYAEKRTNILKERVKTGNTSPSEAAMAEQELNDARIRLEEACAKVGAKKNTTEVEKPAQP